MLGMMDTALKEARDVLDAAVQGKAMSSTHYYSTPGGGGPAEDDEDVKARRAAVEHELNRRFYPGESAENLFVPSRWNAASNFYRHTFAVPFTVDQDDDGHDVGTNNNGGDDPYNTPSAGMRLASNKKLAGATPRSAVRIIAVSYAQETSSVAVRDHAAPAPSRGPVVNDSFGQPVVPPAKNLKKELLSYAPSRIDARQHQQQQFSAGPEAAAQRSLPRRSVSPPVQAHNTSETTTTTTTTTRVVTRDMADTYATVVRRTEHQQQEEAFPVATRAASRTITGGSPAGRKSVLRPGELGLSSRFIGPSCNASNITTTPLIVGIGKVVLEGSAITGLGPLTRCIRILTMSNTNVGLQGPRRPPVRFDMQGQEVKPPPPAQTVADLGGYWVDERVVGIQGVAQRSLALAMLLPMLYTTDIPERLQVTEFVADNCSLTDADAIGLAALLKPLPQPLHCHLTVLSLRNNNFTNVGVQALKKAVKHNKTICEIRLDGNGDVSDFEILRTIEKRLAENRRHAPAQPSSLQTSEAAPNLSSGSPQATRPPVARGQEEPSPPQRQPSPRGGSPSNSPNVPEQQQQQQGGAAGANNTSISSPSPSPGRRSLLQPGELGLSARFLGHRCNAANITTVALLVGLSRVVSSTTQISQTAALRKNVVTYLNLSNTRLGLQGPRRPPVRFDEDNQEIDPPPLAAHHASELGGYWVDEASAGVSGIAKRSLALAVVMPLLHIHRPMQFQIKELVADNCTLNDGDAQGLAAVLRMVSMNMGAHSASYLTTLSLRNNSITDVGADALKKAVKYNRTICEVRLDGNAGITNLNILRTMEKRLEENRRKAQ